MQTASVQTSYNLHHSHSDTHYFSCLNFLRLARTASFLEKSQLHTRQAHDFERKIILAMILYSEMCPTLVYKTEFFQCPMQELPTIDFMCMNERQEFLFVFILIHCLFVLCHYVDSLVLFIQFRGDFQVRRLTLLVMPKRSRIFDSFLCFLFYLENNPSLYSCRTII